MSFDAGAIEASLSVKLDQFDRDLDHAEARVRELESRPHRIKIEAVFDESGMSKARQLFSRLDQQLSMDAANRLRNSPQGSVLGALNSLFSPHPVTGAPTVSQSAQQGLLGKIASSAAPGSGAGLAKPQATAPGAPQEQAAQQQNNRGFLSGLLAGRGGGGGGGGGLGSFLSGFLARGGGGGGGGLAGGIAGGIGPGILGISAKAATGVGLGGSLLGALPALVAPIAGLGVGAAGLGVVGLAAKELIGTKNQAGQSPTQGPLYAAAQSAMNSFKSGFKSAASTLIDPLKDAFKQIPAFMKSLTPDFRSFFASAGTLIQPVLSGLHDLFTMILPGLGQAFRATAPLMRPLIDGLGGLVKGLLPGLVSLLRAAMPAVTVFAQILATLGSDLGRMLSDFAPVLGQSSILLKALLDVVGALFPVIGRLAAIFATALAPVFTVFASAIKAMLPALTILGKVLGAFAAAVLGDLGSAFGAVATLIKDITPSLNILAKAFSSVFSVLENSGVFADLGNVLETIAPTLANLINTLVRQLAPELPIIINLVGQFATVLTQLAAAGLVEVLKGITFLLQKMPFLVPVIGAVAAAWLAWNLVMSANPIGLIIIAIAALVGAITYLVTHWKQVWADIKTWAMDAWNFIYNGFGKYLLPLLGPVGLIVLGAIEVSKHWKTIWGGIKAIAQDFYNWIWNDFGAKIFNFLTKTLPGFFGDAVQGIVTAWDAIKQAVETPINWVITNVIDGLIKAFNWVSSKVGGPTIGLLGPLGVPTSSGNTGGGGGGGATNPLGSPKLAAAGWRVPGFGGGDKHAALLEGGETVVDKWRSKMLAPLFAAMGVPGYQNGGIIGGISHAIGAGIKIARIYSDITTGNSADLATLILSMVPKGTGGAIGDLATVLTDIPHKLAASGAASLLTTSLAGAKFALGVGLPAGHGGIGGGVQRWAGLVLEVLRMLHQPAADLGTVLSQMTTESGGNPFAINLTDSNAAAGDPSRGLMQVIGTTFAAYAGQFLRRGIYDPLANIYAGLNYAIHRYGAGWTSVLGHGHGYDHGGWMTGPPNYTGQPEAVLTPAQSSAFTTLAQTVAAMAAGSGGPGFGDVVDRLERLISAAQQIPPQTAAGIGDVLNGVARGARQRAGYP